MESSDILILGLLLTPVVILSIFLFVYSKKHRKKINSKRNDEKRKLTQNNTFNFIYNLYKYTPGLNVLFKKVKSSVAIMYPADEVSQKKKVTDILIRASFTGVIIIVVTLFVAGQDIYMLLVGFSLAFIVVTSIINNKLKAMKRVLLLQFADFLTNIRHQYHTDNNITKALKASIHEAKYEIGLHIQNIYDIINSPDMMNEVEAYVGHEPSPYILMFLSLCASIKEFGDAKLEDGTSLFLTDIKYLKEEVNNEIINTRKNEAAFKSLPIITLLPLGVVKPLQWWAQSNFDGIDNYYSGIIGIVSLIAVFIVSLAAHTLIVTLRDGNEIEQKERDFFSTLSEYPIVNPYLTMLTNHFYVKYENYNDAMKGMGDYTGKKAFLLKQFVFAISGFLLCLFVFIAGSITGRYVTQHNWKGTFEETVTPSEQYKESMETVSEDYMNYIKANPSVNQEELTKHIMLNTDINDEQYASIIATEVINRYDKYSNTYFQWWQLLLSVILACLAFFIPVFYLKFKRNLIEMRKEDEVVRFQSIMLILMYMNGTTLRIILEWMERFSYSFRTSIAKCRTNLSRGSDEAVQEMKDEENFRPFKDFCDSLLAIDKVGVEKAFDEIKVDRTYFLEKRKQDSEDTIRKKSGTAKLIYIIPLAIAIVLYLIAPMAVYTINMMQGMQDLMSLG